MLFLLLPAFQGTEWQVGAVGSDGTLQLMPQCSEIADALEKPLETELSMNKIQGCVLPVLGKRGTSWLLLAKGSH